MNIQESFFPARVDKEPRSTQGHYTVGLAEAKRDLSREPLRCELSGWDHAMLCAPPNRDDPVQPSPITDSELLVKGVVMNLGQGS